ncbi:DUF974-domain-containing protein [Neoconidiobolus thromboides FSU 785]|nr:DUF974-domain-containing protein [Neoconidiobolus thromboides FSU 785]
MAAVEVVQDEDQLMSLKVMRLSRPEFEIRIHNTNFELSPVLSLPNPSDTIYLGETFSCYISVNNETDKVLQHMTLKVELQATYRHFSLVDTTINPQDISSNDSAQFIVHHEVKELGMHFLLCSVHYVTTNQERKFFKKIYKINVLNPLAVKTKANNLKGGGAVLLEVQVQNLSTSTMYLDNMKFEPNSESSEKKETSDDVNDEAVNSTRVNESEKNKVVETAPNSRKELFGNLNYLKPKDVRQYLYKLEPKDPIDNSAYISNELGKLDIIWKTSFGGSGRLQTSQLTRRAPQIEIIDLKVIEVQKQIYLDCPFFVELKLQNRGDKVMHIELSTERLKMTSILYKGVSPRDLGPIAPGGLINFKLEFLPLSPGPHKLGGIKIMDMFTHNVAEFDQIAEVFISN